MPYYIGDVIKDQRHLIARTPEEFSKSGITVLLNTGVEEIDSNHRTVRLSTGASLPYDHLVLATGAEAVLPGIPGEDLPGVFTLRTLRDALNMKACIQQRHCRRAVIIGAGFIAMEMSEAFRNLDIEVHVLQRDAMMIKRWDPQLTGRVMETMQKEAIQFLPNTRTTGITERGDKFRVITDHGDIDTDIVLIAIGVRPNTGLARNICLPLGESSAIRVNLSQQTSVEGISAVGDCCEVFHRVSKRWVFHPLGDIANKQGRIAGRSIAGEAAFFPGIVGAQSFKFFDLELAATGLDELEALRSGFDPVSTIAWGPPVARPMASPEDGMTGLKLIADRSSRLVLGAQAVGKKDPVRKINAISAALWNGIRLDELALMDFAYSPPFGGPWDLVHITSQLLLRKL